MKILFLKKFGIYNVGDIIRIERFYTDYGPDIELLNTLCSNGYATKLEECDR